MLGIIIGLVLLMFLAYRGYSILWVAPVCALVVGLSGGLNALDLYRETYMTGLAGYVKSWFPVFMLGAIFGHLMDYTGSAKSIAHWLTKTLGAKRAIIGVVVGCGVLTYGGISLFVVVFAMYPLALELFREANITRKLIPGAIALGSFTFTMTAIPGTPQIQNIIPTNYYGTSPTAAPIMGTLAAVLMFVLGVLWLQRREKKFTAAGDVFTEPKNKEAAVIDYSKLPNPFLSFLPLVTVIVTMNIFDWDIVIALLCGIILAMILNFNKYQGFTKSISNGAVGSITAILNTAAAVGFGTVVKSVPGFATLTGILLNVPGTPLISEAIAVNLLAGATGSASGGMSIALEALGEKYLAIAMETGISPEAFHRVASLASGGLDTLPHNGAVLTLLAVTGMTHKDSYIDICMTSLVLPLVASIPAILIGSLGIY
ncbi:MULTISPECIES: GntP family permease [unclassified Sedimentibacter]|uniref:GntP family permease n=1 Tax=unclassified Sedimentibacter TaxID=2649220 RepID=UPI0027E15E09|nr:GntP family permease [Sedimentibacter sp. MB35-C1]WMJ76424.1 GntP family permease [Sedimentibacter sp. MB35-C1]